MCVCVCVCVCVSVCVCVCGRDVEFYRIFESHNSKISPIIHF